jgi:hypothetical protein
MLAEMVAPSVPSTTGSGCTLTIAGFWFESVFTDGLFGSTLPAEGCEPAAPRWVLGPTEAWPTFARDDSDWDDPTTVNVSTGADNGPVLPAST